MGKGVKFKEPLVFLLTSRRAVAFGPHPSPAGIGTNPKFVWKPSFRAGCLLCKRGVTMG